MAQFTEFTFAEIPEVFPDEQERTQELLERVLDYDLAGFVMRRSGVIPFDPSELLQLQGGPIMLRKCAMLPITRDMVYGHDYGLHIDVKEVLSEPLMNLHTTVVGQAQVRLFRAQPTVVDASKLPTLESNDPYDAESREQYRLGKVDGGLFVPVCHQTELYPADTLAFLDWRTAHDFVTLFDEPRTYSSGLYPIRRSTT